MTNKKITAAITSVGHFLPEYRLTNKMLEGIVDTNDEWIVTRTGIRERRIAKDSEAISDLAIPAARRAVEMAGGDLATIELVIVANYWPDTDDPTPEVAERFGR